MGTKYPECDKMLAVQNESGPITEFLNWLRSKGVWLVLPIEPTKKNGYARSKPAFQNHEHMLAEFFEIDLSLVEKERREMLG